MSKRDLDTLSACKEKADCETAEQRFRCLQAETNLRLASYQRAVLCVVIAATEDREGWNCRGAESGGLTPAAEP